MCQPCLLTLDSCRLHFAGDKKQTSPAGAHPCQNVHSLPFFSAAQGLSSTSGISLLGWLSPGGSHTLTEAWTMHSPPPLHFLTAVGMSQKVTQMPSPALTGIRSLQTFQKCLK